jgi:hypothetical protein
VSLDEAYLRFLYAAFAIAPPEGLELAEFRLLHPDAAAALARIDRRHGNIFRHPDLAFADDDWDLVANRLIAEKRISIDDARDDVLIHRLFLNAFRDQIWFMTGREQDRAGEERHIDWPTIRALHTIRLRESTIQESGGRLRYAASRVWSRDYLPANLRTAIELVSVLAECAPATIAETAAEGRPLTGTRPQKDNGNASTGKKPPRKRKGFREIEIIVGDLQIDLAAYYNRPPSAFACEIADGWRKRASRGEPDFKPLPSHRKCPEWDAFRQRCARFLKAEKNSSA